MDTHYVCLNYFFFSHHILYKLNISLNEKKNNSVYKRSYIFLLYVNIIVLKNLVFLFKILGREI